MTEMVSSRPSAANTTKAPARRRGGPSKATLGRAKLAAIALSAVAFVGSLAGVMRATPNTVGAQAASQPTAQQLAQAVPVAPQRPAFILPQDLGQSELVMPTRPQMPTLRPFARTRGS